MCTHMKHAGPDFPGNKCFNIHKYNIPVFIIAIASAVHHFNSNTPQPQFCPTVQNDIGKHPWANEVMPFALQSCNLPFGTCEGVREERHAVALRRREPPT